MKHLRRHDEPTRATSGQTTDPTVSGTTTGTTSGSHAGTPGTTAGGAVPTQRGTGEHVERTEHVEHVDHRGDDRAAHARHDRHDEPVHERRGESAHDRFGGMNLGAAFFGWLVAIGVAILLIGIVSAVLTAIGSQMQLSQAEATSNAGGYGLAAAITLGVILLIAYYAGGYVAGRMSRFDGAKQGLGVWLIGLLVTIIVAVVGAVAGSQYDILSRVNLPSIPVSTDSLTIGGIITLVAVVVLTAVAAVLGGIAGHRYHNKVDRAAGIR